MKLNSLIINFVFAATFVVSSSLLAAQTVGHSTPRLYNPKDLTVEKSESWRFTVNIMTDYSQCTASFITPTTLITAAHCITDELGVLQTGTPLEITFFWGSEPYSRVDLEAKDIELLTHSYRDVGLIKLKVNTMPDDDYYAIPLAMDYLSRFSHLSQYTMYIAGTGWTNKMEDSSIYLGFVQGSYYGFYGEWDSYMVDIVKGQGICLGDSGGPVMISVGNRLALAGITAATSGDLHSEPACGNWLGFEGLEGDIFDWVYSNMW